MIPTQSGRPCLDGDHDADLSEEEDVELVEADP